MPTVRRRQPPPFPPAVIETASKLVAVLAMAAMATMLPLAAHAMPA